MSIGQISQRIAATRMAASPLTNYDETDMLNPPMVNRPPAFIRIENS